MSQPFHILRIIQSYNLINVHRSSCNVPVILVRFQSNWNFPEIFSNNPKISNFTKILAVEAELFHADKTDGRTDGETIHEKLTVDFCNFANALNKCG